MSYKGTVTTYLQMKMHDRKEMTNHELLQNKSYLKLCTCEFLSVHGIRRECSSSTFL